MSEFISEAVDKILKGSSITETLNETIINESLKVLRAEITKGRNSPVLNCSIQDIVEELKDKYKVEW